MHSLSNSIVASKTSLVNPWSKNKKNKVFPNLVQEFHSRMTWPPFRLLTMLNNNPQNIDFSKIRNSHMAKKLH